MRRRWYWWAAAGIVLILLIIVVDKAEDVMSHIEYPLDVWRMDLDDIAANIGFFLVGVAAFASLWRKAGRAHDKADEASKDINGGLANLASQIITDELRQSDIEVGLHKRVTALEKLTAEYIRREVVWDEEKEQIRLDRVALRDWLNRRLDESGNGRNEAR